MAILLHISQEALSQRITAMEGRMTELRGIYDEYDALNKDVKSFLGDTDDNFDRMQENVHQNIRAVIKAYNIAKANKEQLERELSSLDSLMGAVGSTLDNAVSTAKGVFDVINIADDLNL